MPHKRNPITGERLSGLARVLRGNAVAALESGTMITEVSPLAAALAAAGAPLAQEFYGTINKVGAVAGP